MKDLKKNKSKKELISEKKVKKYNNDEIIPLYLKNFIAIGKHRSIRRAIKRGHITYEGIIMPSRPFNNKKDSYKRGKHSRALNEEKKKIYARITEYGRE